MTMETRTNHSDSDEWEVVSSGQDMELVDEVKEETDSQKRQQQHTLTQESQEQVSTATTNGNELAMTTSNDNGEKTEEEEEIHFVPDSDSENEETAKPVDVGEAMETNTATPHEETIMDPSVAAAAQASTVQPPPEPTTSTTTPILEDPRGPADAIISLWGSSVRALGALASDLDEQHHLRRKTRNSVQKVGKVLQDFEEEHHLQRKTQNSMKKIGNLLTSTTQQVTETVQTAYTEHKVEERASQMGQQISKSAQLVGAQAAALNEQYNVTETLAVASVVGAGALLAKGKNNKAVAAVLAAGGAAYVTGEALKEPRSRRRHDSGMNEHIHME